MTTTQTSLPSPEEMSEEEAFRSLVNEYQDFVYAVCRRMLSPAEAEDAVQDVFFKLLKHAGQLRGDLSGWIHRCSVNTCRDLIRRRDTRRRHEAAAAGSEMMQPNESRVELLRHVDEALLELDVPDRELIMRYFMRGETQQDIADDLQVHQTTAKRRIDEALSRLRKRLSKRGLAGALASLGSLLMTQSAEARVPDAIAENLTKMALASSQPVAVDVSSASGVGQSGMGQSGMGHSAMGSEGLAPSSVGGSWPVAATAIGMFILSVIGWFAWTQSDRSGQAAGGSAGENGPVAIQSEGGEPALGVAPVNPLGDAVEQQTTEKILTSECLFTVEYSMEQNPSPQELIGDAYVELEDSGYEPIGNPMFMTEDGLGIDPEVTVVIGIPIVDPKSTFDSRIVVTEPQRMICLPATPGSNPMSVIHQTAKEIESRGYERTYRDRFVIRNDDDGLDYEVQMGVE